MVIVTVTSEILVHVHDYNSYKRLLLGITNTQSVNDQVSLTTDRQLSRHKIYRHELASGHVKMRPANTQKGDIAESRVLSNLSFRSTS